MTLPRWTICVLHSILITDEMHGSCPQCNGEPDWKRFAMHLRNIARVYLEALKRQ